LIGADLFVRGRAVRFGAFRVRAERGGGRFGPTYLADDPATKTQVLIQIVEVPHGPRRAPAKASLLEAFRALCAVDLRHPGIACPMSCGVQGDTPYLVYASAPGTTMDVLAQRGAMRPADVLARIAHIAAAIDHAASAGIHHGALAPRDIVAGVDKVGVMGFGLVQALVRAGIPIDAQVPYASPQRRAGMPPTTADDIYSLAAVTLEMLIGRWPWSRQDADPTPRPAPREMRLLGAITGVDDRLLRDTFASALSNEPAARPARASTFVVSLRRAMVTARATRPAAEAVDSSAVMEFLSEEKVRRSPAERVSPVVTRQAHPVTAARRSRRAVLLSILGAAGLGAVFAGGFFLSKTDVRVDTPAAEAPPVQSQPTAAAPDARETNVPAQVQERGPETTTEVVAPVAVDARIGRIVVRSMPDGSAVTVDGEFRGATPLTLRNLMLGERMIEIASLGYDTRQQVITLTAKYPARSIDVELSPVGATDAVALAGSAPGALQVLTRPSEARVFVDDNLVGTAPLLLPGLAAGSHRVRLELAGRQTWSSSIQIEPNQRFRIAVSLEP